MNDYISRKAVVGEIQARIKIQRSWGTYTNIEITKELSALLEDIESLPSFPSPAEGEMKVLFDGLADLEELDAELRRLREAEGRYREALKRIANSDIAYYPDHQEMANGLKRIAREALPTIGEQKEDKTCVMCRKREGVNLSTANRWYCEPCTDALPSADKEEEQK